MTAGAAFAGGTLGDDVSSPREVGRIMEIGSSVHRTL